MVIPSRGLQPSVIQLHEPVPGYVIEGVSVEFPYRPYFPQIGVIRTVLRTLRRTEAASSSHSLIEVPAGTGKSLALLCAALSWQQRLKDNSRSQAPASRNPDTAPPAANNAKNKIPAIYYACVQRAPQSIASPIRIDRNVQTIYSYVLLAPKRARRTHAQLSQVVGEYQKTGLIMAVLDLRKHCCTNENLQGHADIDMECKGLLKNWEAGCPEFKNIQKVKNDSTLKKGGCFEVHSIEDLVQVGKHVKARSMASDAELVFCPYSYIINPAIRRALDVNIEGSILIIDESHNIEDICHDVGSVDVGMKCLNDLYFHQSHLECSDPETYKPLKDMILNIKCWMQVQDHSLRMQSSTCWASWWTDKEALNQLSKASVTKESFSNLQECASKAIKAASKAVPKTVYLCNNEAPLLEGLFSSLNYFFSDGVKSARSYQLVIRCTKRNSGVLNGEWETPLSLWCLHASIVFKEIADSCLSVILASGTLFPFSSVSSELGVTFGNTFQAPHVIDVQKQLWAGVISRGPTGVPLNGSYATSASDIFRSELCSSLEEIFKIVPGGCIVFFPSYSMLNDICQHWKLSKQWDRLTAQKTIFVETRQDQKSFETTLAGYFSFINQREKLPMGSNEKEKLPALSGSTSHENKKQGAAFLAVYQGKISEGIDFSYEKARAVIFIGIPYPDKDDLRFKLKMMFNNAYASYSVQLLRLNIDLVKGEDWYNIQAFKALNQAAGRCIRPRHDYGAFIFIDERFSEKSQRYPLSDWFKETVINYSRFEDAIEKVSHFSTHKMGS